MWIFIKLILTLIQCNIFLIRDWSKSVGGRPEQRGGGLASFNLQLPLGVGHPVFNSKWQTVDTMNNTGNSFLFQRTKLFEPWLKMYTWLVYNRNDNFMYCKICAMAKTSNRLSKEFQGRTFQNAALCRYAGLQEQNGNFLDTPSYHIPAGASVLSGVPAVFVLLFESSLRSEGANPAWNSFFQEPVRGMCRQKQRIGLRLEVI